MSHFAKVENGIVTQVIVAEQDFINSGVLGDPSAWIQTSYNTRGNVHYGSDGQPDNGEALRGNYAGVGFTYDKENDVFYPPQPYPSWTIGSQYNWTWTPPVPYPTDLGTPEEPKRYVWDEETKAWNLVT